MEISMTATATTDLSKRPLVERHYEGKPKRPQMPHVVHLRELLMPDGRRLLLDRRSIAFLCQGKAEDFGGRQVTIIGFKTIARACPVVTPYAELKAWWAGAASAKGEPRPDHHGGPALHPHVDELQGSATESGYPQATENF
jgi:hypothetical protein